MRPYSLPMSVLADQPTSQSEWLPVLSSRWPRRTRGWTRASVHPYGAADLTVKLIPGVVVSCITVL